MNDSSDDDQLMQDYVTGKDGAFEMIFERYAGLLVRILSRSCAQDVAEDLVQQSFLQMHRARHDYCVGQGGLRPWLVTIAFNLQRSHFRKLGKRTYLEFDENLHDMARGSQGDLGSRSVSSSDQQQVQQAIRKLPESQREIVTLHWYEGFSFEEVAKMLGIKRSAAKVRAHRAYKHLRRSLENNVTKAPAQAYKE